MWGPALLAFLIATVITLVELITSQYARTAFLIAKCRWLYLYAAIYGLVALGVTLIWPALQADGAAIEGAGTANPWVLGIALGLSAKALLHIRLFNITTGPGKSFPFGLESLVQLFEPWLLRSIELSYFDRLKAFLAPWLAKYSDIGQVRQRIENNIPSNFTSQEQGALLDDIKATNSVERVMAIYLTYVGRDIFARVFPS